MRALAPAMAGVVGLLLVGCPSGHLTPGADAGPPPSPADQLVAAIGRDATLDVGAWNLHNFPCGNGSSSTTCRAHADETPAFVASLIAALDVDLLAVEEIDDEAAFHQMVAALPDRDSVLSTHTYGDGTYQKVGFIYKTTVLDAGTPALLFNFDSNFPRPALQVPFQWKGPGAPLSFDAVAVHLKAGSAPEDHGRRVRAAQEMAAYATSLVDTGDEPNVIFLGDFNETLHGTGEETFVPFQDDRRFTIETQAASDAGEVSFLPSSVMLDHIVTTTGLAHALGNAHAAIPRIDADVPDYLDVVSDHLPVFLSVPNP